MKVGIHGEQLDSQVTPIVLILSDKDRECIATMDPRAKAICFYPQFTDVRIIEKFMEYHVPRDPLPLPGEFEIPVKTVQSVDFEKENEQLRELITAMGIDVNTLTNNS